MMTIVGNDDIAPAIPVNGYPSYGESYVLRLEAAVETIVELDDRLPIVCFLA